MRRPLLPLRPAEAGFLRTDLEERPGMAEERRHLPDLSLVLQGLRRQRHRGHPGRHLEARLHPEPRRDRHLVQPRVRLRLDRRRLRHPGFLPHRSPFRHQQRPGRTGAEVPRARHQGAARPRGGAYLRQASLVPPECRGHEPPLLRLLHLERPPAGRQGRKGPGGDAEGSELHAEHPRQVDEERLSAGEILQQEFLRLPARPQLRLRQPGSEPSVGAVRGCARPPRRPAGTQEHHGLLV